ncbi:MAG: hypothetical protein WCT26_01655 [Candidatus Buchananbacteria bacterium]|jgi:hypothetical protein
MPEGEDRFIRPTEEEEVLPPISTGDDLEADIENDKQPRDKDAEENYDSPERAR